MVYQGIAEKGPVVPRLAAEGRTVLGRGSDDDGAWTLERGHELAGEAGLEDQQAVFEAERAQHRGEPQRRDYAAAAPQVLVDEADVGVAVAGAVEHEHVFVP